MTKGKKTARAEVESTTQVEQPAAVPEKISALDAAARVLSEEGKALGCKELIELMAQKGYWSSPAGKTPSATLYSALLREINTKGDDSRFAKADRGLFALRGQSATQAEPAKPEAKWQKAKKPRAKKPEVTGDGPEAVKELI